MLHNENVDPNLQPRDRKNKPASSSKQAKKNNNGANLPKFKKDGAKTGTPRNVRTRRRCQIKEDHICGDHCMTPLPTRLCSMTSRRKKNLRTVATNQGNEAKRVKVDKKQWRKNMEVDLFKRLNRKSLLSEELRSVTSAIPEKKMEPTEQPTLVPAPLRSKTLAGIAHHIDRQRCRNIIVMSGAGISCSAGIPDFRSPKTGLYYNLQKYDLPTPTAIFDIAYFVKRPEPFFTLAKELYPGNFKPTPVHYFIRLLHEKGLLLRNYTQNIDGLERIAGLPAEAIVEAHGSFYYAHCISCNTEHSPADIKEKIFRDEVPRCSACGGLVKPDITFFGEPLPERFFNLADEDFKKCDLLIVLGTSLKVNPFNQLITKVDAATPRILINREQVGVELDGKKDEKCFRFDECDNDRDAQYLGNCDAAVNLLVDMLGWRDEFAALQE